MSTKTSMAFKLTSIILALFMPIAGSCTEYIPVMLWESNGSSEEDIEVLALNMMDEAAFENLLLKKEADKDLVLLFAEETLGVEDFIQHSFPELESLSSTSKLLYLPGVNEPMTVLYDLPKSFNQWHSYLASDVLDQMFELNVTDRYVLIFFDDATEKESRIDLLKQHDAFIKVVYEKLKAERNVLGIYSAQQASWHSAEEARVREIRDVYEEETREVEFPCCLYYEPPIMIYSSSVPFLYYKCNCSVVPFCCFSGVFMLLTQERGCDSGFDLVPTKFTSVEIEDDVYEILQLQYVYDFDRTITLRFNFSLEEKSRTWELQSVLFVEGDNTTLYYSGPGSISAPLGFSYHCSACNNTFLSNNSALIFQDLQVQAFMKNSSIFANGTLGKFGDAVDCVDFITVPIFSGLIIFFFLAGVLACSLSMLQNIKTMDRFDDPKKKTITVLADSRLLRDKI